MLFSAPVIGIRTSVFISCFCWLLVAFGGLQASVGMAAVHDVTRSGVVGDGKTLNTAAIQRVIDACAGEGGGTVHFPAGDYLTGTIYLKDNVRLDLAAEARILGSTEVAHYPIMLCDFPSRVDNYNARALIWGEGLKNIGITGQGIVDGQGPAFHGKMASVAEMTQVKQLFAAHGRYVPEESYLNRPFLIRLIGCREILVEGVTLRCSAMWMQHYHNCDDVTIRGITVFNHGCRNNDMIDIDGCRNVVIADCVADTSDDGLTLKSTGNAATENVTVTNCTMRSHCNPIKAGTESAGGFKNITIRDCAVKPSEVDEVLLGRREGLAGIALEIVDGGTLENVHVSNITVEGTHAPIFMRLGNRGRPAKRIGPAQPVGTFRNVVFHNIVAAAASQTGCSITGIPGHRIENVTLSDVRIEVAGGGVSQHAPDGVPELEGQYPECIMFGVLPAYGFFCRHVDGLKLEKVKVHSKQPDARPVLIFHDVLNARVHGDAG
ncbi:MAG TPA: glycoside hydrolase [Planctomycetaceae bacterium]|nr:glycoside hydrolase [Planctomycetaceae bacterium]